MAPVPPVRIAVNAETQGRSTLQVRNRLVKNLRAFAPVKTGRLRRSIKRTMYGVRIGVRYASYTNRRGSAAGWIDRAIGLTRVPRGIIVTTDM